VLVTCHRPSRSSGCHFCSVSGYVLGSNLALKQHD